MVPSSRLVLACFTGAFVLAACNNNSFQADSSKSSDLKKKGSLNSNDPPATSSLPPDTWTKTGTTNTRMQIPVGSHQEIAPAGTPGFENFDCRVTSGETQASYDPNSGTVTGKKVGTATIVCTKQDDPNTSVTVGVDVTPAGVPPPTNISDNPGATVDDGGFDASKQWGGFYRPYADGFCRVPNPLTQGCNCPKGAKAFQFNSFRGGISDTYYLHPDGAPTTTVHGIDAFYCTQDPARGSPKESFRGAYRVDANGACRFPNPFTGGCSCKSEDKDVVIHSLDVKSHTEYISNAMTIHACLDPVKPGPITGGFFRQYSEGTEVRSCDIPNSYSGGCICPNGFAPQLMDEFFDGYRYFYDSPTNNIGVFQCVKP